jgi:hypothetical protein
MEERKMENQVQEKPKCKLVGEDGNAYAIMGRVKKALRDAGQGDKVPEFLAKAMSGDYDNLLVTCLEYVDEEDDNPPEEEEEGFIDYDVEDEDD